MKNVSYRKRKTGRERGRLALTTEDERWLSSVLSTATTDSDDQTKILELLLKWNVYTSIDELPFSVFEDVSVDGDMRLLSKEKDCPREVLDYAWNTLQSQFSEAMGGESTQRAISLDAEVTAIDSNLDIIQALIDGMLRSAPYIGPAPELIEAFSDFGYDRTFTEESWRDDLAWVREAAQGLVMERDMKKKEIEVLMPANKAASKPTRESYAVAFVNISKHVRFNVNKHEITTRTFCLYYRSYITYVEAQNSRPAKGKVQPGEEDS